MTGIALGMDGADLGVRLCRQGNAQRRSFGGLTFFHLPHRNPVCPDAGEGRRAGRLSSSAKPDVAALGLVEFAEAVETVPRNGFLDAQPSCPVLGFSRLRMLVVPAVGLHPEQFLEVDRFALGFQFCGRAFLVASIKRVLRRRPCPRRAVASSRPIGAGRARSAPNNRGNTPGIGARLPDRIGLTTRNSAMIGGLGWW